MTHPSPRDTHLADQHYAEIAEQLGLLVASFGRFADIDTVRRLDTLSARLADPHKNDGTCITHEAHVGTLVNLLAVAISQLAAAKENPK